MSSSKPYTVTIFGAESTGKTTLAKALAHWFDGAYAVEWARPYLEWSGPEITVEKMHTIWEYQLKQQITVQSTVHSYLIQDTDLFSTVGFWDYWNGMTPKALVEDALDNKSDLYILTPSNIPFEPDQLRYGGDKRETTDQYWVDLLERYELNYQVLESDDLEDRIADAIDIIESELIK
jgi:HTH-type transcriptional regulator, transcriptional repressor of NAD biosynthesis genes